MEEKRGKGNPSVKSEATVMVGSLKMHFPSPNGKKPQAIND